MLDTCQHVLVESSAWGGRSTRQHVDTGESNLLLNDERGWHSQASFTASSDTFYELVTGTTEDVPRHCTHCPSQPTISRLLDH